MRAFMNFAFCIGLLSMGCQANNEDIGTPFEITPSPIVEPVSPNSGESHMTPSLPADAGLQHLIEKAIADLAKRLSIPVTQVTLVEAAPVTWPDASLGCPQEGMGYAQVLTPGYLIKLRSGDRDYEYHANRDTYLVYCENPMPPVPGMPPDI